ncbi:hypothetical protein OAU44_00090 [bacterium]|nr:hypothetical protein [bacterium]
MKYSIIALAILVVGMPFVFAEKATVEVPFDSHGQTCSFDEIAVEFHCVWQGWKEVYTLEDLKEYKELLTAERYDQEIQKLNEKALAEIAVEQAKLTPDEKTIQEIERKLEKGIATARESVHMNLLKELDTCQQGMDVNTAPFQTAREVTKSSFDKWMYNNVHYEGQVLEIVLAIEECKAQIHVFKAGVGYQNFPTGDADYQFSLQDVYTSDIQAVNFDDFTSTSRNINESLICDNNQFADTHKVQFGCEVLYDGKTAEQIRLENELRFGTDGQIHYQSQVLDDYMDFMNEYGNRYATVDDKKVQELIAEPIARNAIEDNNFYQNKLKNED